MSEANLPMTKAEAWSTLRALETAIETERTAPEDKPRLKWVHERLFRILDPKYAGVSLVSKAVDTDNAIKFRAAFTATSVGGSSILEESIEDAAHEKANERDDYPFIIQHLKEFASRWVTDDEFITVEFDTGAGTATVIPDNEK